MTVKKNYQNFNKNVRTLSFQTFAENAFKYLKINAFNYVFYKKKCKFERLLTELKPQTIKLIFQITIKSDIL